MYVVVSRVKNVTRCHVRIEILIVFVLANMSTALCEICGKTVIAYPVLLVVSETNTYYRVFLVLSHAPFIHSE